MRRHLITWMLACLTWACLGTAWAATYTTAQDGNWTTGSTWSGGSAPPSTLNSGDTVNIRHRVGYNTGSALELNSGATVRIEPQGLVATTPRLDVPTNININIKPGGTMVIDKGALVQRRFVGGGNTGTPQSGTLKNEGTLFVNDSTVEIAQDWLNAGGTREFRNGCLITGQNIKSDGGSDALVNSTISLGWHGSGNFSVASDNPYRLSRARVQLAGTSGNFELNSGVVRGDTVGEQPNVDYITLKNQVSGTVGSGKIVASSSLTTPDGLIDLDAYCAPVYEPNGKFTGTRTNEARPACPLTTTYFPCLGGTPGLSLAKSITSGNPYATAGNVIQYQIVATNSGNLTLRNVTVSDPLLGALSCSAPSPVTLGAGQSVICTGSLTVTQSQVNAGSIVNTASAAAIDPNDNPISATASATAVVTSAPGLSLTKTSTQATYSAVGNVINYSMTATNTGNVTLTGVSIADAALGTLTCTQPATLAPGATLTCTGSRAVTQADLDNGSYTNTASTQGTPPAGPNVTATASRTVTAQQTAALSLAKSASPTTYTTAGTAIGYSITATNTGNVTLTSVSITDAALGTLTCTQPVTLAPGATLVCTGSRNVTQADVNAGSYTNTASVSGTRPGGGAVGPVTATATVNASSAPAITLTKTSTQSTYSAVGNVINYSMTATNTGNVTLTGVSITDAALGTLTCTQPATLAPSATLTCTGSRAVTQTDLDNGSYTNTASTQGTPPAGPNVTATASRTVTAQQTAALSLAKSASPTTYTTAGTAIGYSITATNTGNVTLTSVSITDAALGTLTCTQPATLAPGATLVCTGSRNVTQDDVNAGSYTNTASVSGTRPGGGAVGPVTASATVTATQGPSITLTKTSTQSTYSAVGNVINYSMTATNTGNVTLTGVSITDAALGALTCTQPATLAPSAALTCTGSRAVTQADLDSGSYTNTASTQGTPPVGPNVTATANRTVNAQQTATIALQKTSDIGALGAVGTVATYTITGTNSGNVTLSNVTVTDPAVSGLTCNPAAPATLAPGQSIVCTGTRATLQADINAGSYTNTASITGRAPGGGTVGPVTASRTLLASQGPSLAISKAASPATYSAAGQSIAYTITVVNDGNVSLTNVSVSDPKVTGLSCTPAVPVATLAPAASITCTGTHLTTQANVDAGSYTNTATASGTAPGSVPVGPVTASRTVNAVQTPGLSLTKTASPGTYSKAGDVITYTLTATNTGNVTLTSVQITDAKVVTLNCSPTLPASLAPGASATCTGTRAVTQTDVDNGSFTNTASAQANTPSGTIGPVEASRTVTSGQSASLGLQKTASSGLLGAAGTVITYTVTGTNTGSVTLSSVTVSDPALANLSCVPATPAVLAPGQSIVCTGTRATSQADVAAGSFTNTASITGQNPAGGTVGPTFANRTLVGAPEPGVPTNIPTLGWLALLGLSLLLAVPGAQRLRRGTRAH